MLPRYRRAPVRLDDGAPPHRFECPPDYYGVQYYEASSKVKTQLESWAANSDDFSEHLEELQSSCFGTDIDCGRLAHQLHLVHDAVRTALPEVRQVTLPSDDSRTT